MWAACLTTNRLITSADRRFCSTSASALQAQSWAQREAESNSVGADVCLREESQRLQQQKNKNKKPDSNQKTENVQRHHAGASGGYTAGIMSL